MLTVTKYKILNTGYAAQHSRWVKQTKDDGDLGGQHGILESVLQRIWRQVFIRCMFRHVFGHYGTVSHRIVKSPTVHNKSWGFPTLVSSVLFPI